MTTDPIKSNFAMLRLVLIAIFVCASAAAQTNRLKRTNPFALLL